MRWRPLATRCRRSCGRRKRWHWRGSSRPRCWAPAGQPIRTRTKRRSPSWTRRGDTVCSSQRRRPRSRWAMRSCRRRVRRWRVARSDDAERALALVRLARSLELSPGVDLAQEAVYARCWLLGGLLRCGLWAWRLILLWSGLVRLPRRGFWAVAASGGSCPSGSLPNGARPIASCLGIRSLVGDGAPTHWAPSPRATHRTPLGCGVPRGGYLLSRLEGVEPSVRPPALPWVLTWPRPCASGS